ncbi:hypothetical protein KP509_31G041900 [Ceratopteris richardii]|uniref:Phototropic-responsive NPH3 family protein n=1 Tax=Ceratopteris richardii TaxID=49495 RepID=A0A8T2QY30_CERRI|nr:hypothetical protein KP509_31G041900 [Ceratopteris richardii]
MAAACVKLGSKPETFLRKGEECFCPSGLASDIVIQVQQRSFHLHKFPLVARSGKLAKLLDEVPTQKGDEKLCLELHKIPGGADAFELAAAFCYGFRFELTASNVVQARCAAEYLEMNEDLGEGNLKAKTDDFLHEVVLHSFKECMRALHSCEAVLPHAEELGIVASCIDAVASMACMDHSNLAWPMLHSPGGSLLWNGISTGAKPKKIRTDWWYEDVCVLMLPLFKRVILAVEAQGMKPECIAGALMHFAKKHLPALNNRRQGVRAESSNMGVGSSEGEQKHVLETVESLLPTQKGVVSTKHLSGLLRSATILNASPECKNNLERRLGLQLQQASLEDLLLPNLSYNMETLYDTDCVQRILEHFLLMDQNMSGIEPSPGSIFDGALMSPPSLSPLMEVARLLDSYLAEVAPDVNLKPLKFLSLAEALPEYSRISDDGVYRAIDIFLKAHPWLKEDEREQLCRIMDCQKLSLEACTHAAQNERLPLRVVVQVLFFEQLQLRTAIANCFMMSDTSHALRNQSMTDGLAGTSSSGLMRGPDRCVYFHFQCQGRSCWMCQMRYMFSYEVHVLCALQFMIWVNICQIIS